MTAVLLLALACGPLPAQEGWELLRDGEPIGKVPVLSRAGHSLVALDPVMELLGLSSEEKGGNLILKGPGGSLQVFPGAAAAMYRGEIIPFMHEVLREGGHWWVDPDCALTLAGRISGSGSGGLSWRGEGYQPRQTQYPAPGNGPSVQKPQTPVTPLPGPASASSATVKSIRWGQQDFGLRVVLDLSAPVPLKVEPGSGSVTVTIPGLMSRGTSGTVSPYPSEIGLSVTQFGDRVVLGFRHNASTVRYFSLETPFRQVIDFYDPRPLGTSPVPYSPWTAPPEGTVVEEEPPEEMFQPLSQPVQPPGRTSGGEKTV
ncbi:MAG TPA: hypothetical protein PK146_04670, partial [Synergistales bacterium]|nr:hypothetical protein [Synergistales bacterium]